MVALPCRGRSPVVVARRCACVEPLAIIVYPCLVPPSRPMEVPCIYPVCSGSRHSYIYGGFALVMPVRGENLAAWSLHEDLFCLPISRFFPLAGLTGLGRPCPREMGYRHQSCGYSCAAAGPEREAWCACHYMQGCCTFLLFTALLSWYDALRDGPRGRAGTHPESVAHGVAAGECRICIWNTLQFSSRSLSVLWRGFGHMSLVGPLFPFYAVVCDGCAGWDYDATAFLDSTTVPLDTWLRARGLVA